MKAEIVVGVSKSLQRAGAGGEFLLLVDCILMAPFDGCGVRLEPGVVFNDGKLSHGDFILNIVFYL
ncbi:hypothetical protein IMSAG192_00765 [Muribaculaceae bacterium]|nr:hypothetical protein IMSAG192_00765 [Muribaculaceae bacterium]